MGPGINSSYNFSEFMKMSKKIDDAFAKRVEIAAQMFVNESRIMLEEFKSAQAAAPHEPYPKGKSPDEKDADMGKATAFAASRAGTPYPAGRTPWINHTMRAMRGVHSYAERTDEELTAGLYHTMAYGAYLEFAHNRKYAVIEPIIRKHGPLLLGKLKSLFAGG